MSGTGSERGAAGGGDATGGRAGGRRTGRRPGPQSSRPQILSAARELFGTNGYEGTTVRAVGARAGVDPALVVRFFGGKQGLFEAVLETVSVVPEAMAPVLVARDAGAGARVVRTYLDLWNDPHVAGMLRSLMRAALGSDTAGRMLRDFVVDRALPKGAPWRTGEGFDLRFTLAASQLVGMAATRYVLRVEPLASLPDEAVVRLYGPTIQHYLTGDLDGGVCDSATGQEGATRGGRVTPAT